MSQRTFTDVDVVSALERSGCKVYTLDNLEEWPEPDRSEMRAAIASFSKKLCDAIESDVISELTKSRCLIRALSD